MNSGCDRKAATPSVQYLRLSVNTLLLPIFYPRGEEKESRGEPPDRCNHKSNDIDKLKGRYCPGEKSQVSVSGTQCKLFEVGGFTQAVPDSMEDLSSCVILRYGPFGRQSSGVMDSALLYIAGMQQRDVRVSASRLQ